jgi:hypothetical protein
MKASPTFINILKTGIELLKSQYGIEAIKNLHDMRLYFLVHDAVTFGYEHNAKIKMEHNESFHNEAKNLTDDNIMAAVRKVR